MRQLSSVRTLIASRIIYVSTYLPRSTPTRLITCTVRWCAVETYSLVELLLDERSEQSPDHLEDERLLDDVDLLQPQRQGLLDERQQQLGEGWRESFDLFQRETVKVHDDDGTVDLGGRFQLGDQVDEIEHTEQLLGADLLRIPQGTAVDQQHAASLLVPVRQHIDDVVLGEGASFVLRHQVVQQVMVALLELGNATHL